LGVSIDREEGRDGRFETQEKPIDPNLPSSKKRGLFKIKLERAA
jgi:hypothetical protein